MNLIDKIVAKMNPKRDLSNFSTGDTVTVSVKVKEGEKERIQLFKGTVIKVQGSGVGRSFTVRKMSDGVGVERTWPFASPGVDSVQVNLKGKVRRSRIYYLRGLKGRAARLTTEIIQQEKSGDSVKTKKAQNSEAKSPE